MSRKAGQEIECLSEATLWKQRRRSIISIHTTKRFSVYLHQSHLSRGDNAMNENKKRDKDDSDPEEDSDVEIEGEQFN